MKESEGDIMITEDQHKLIEDQYYEASSLVKELNHVMSEEMTDKELHFRIGKVTERLDVVQSTLSRLYDEIDNQGA